MRVVVSAQSPLARGFAAIAALLVVAAPVHLSAPAASANQAPTGLVAWGKGHLGDGSEQDPATATPRAVKGLTNVRDVAAGASHSLALLTDGTVWAWGTNSGGQLGDGTTLNRSLPIQVKGEAGHGFLQNIVGIDAGAGFSLAVDGSGRAWAWGHNGNGQLGDGTTVNRSLPIQVRDHVGIPLAEISQVTASAHPDGFGLALTRSGNVYAWGDNSHGQLGDGTTTSRPFARLVLRNTRGVALEGIRLIAAIHQRAYAIGNDGTVWGWGSNQHRTLESTHSGERTLPLLVMGTGLKEHKVLELAGSHTHTMGRREDGRVIAWGLQNRGQLGNDVVSNSYVESPVTVKAPSGHGELTGVVAIAASGFISAHIGEQTYLMGASSFAVLSDGRLLAWGNNSSLQFGTASPDHRARPNYVSGILGATGIAAAEFRWIVSGRPLLTVLPEDDLNFGTLGAGLKSPWETIAVVNQGSGPAPLTIDRPGANNWFEVDNGCPAVLPAKTTCTIKVRFTPQSGGNMGNYMYFSHSGMTTPLLRLLYGTGEWASPSVGPTSLSFGNQQVGELSAPKTVTLTNQGAGVLPIGQLYTTGDPAVFQFEHACGASLAPGASCTISVRFGPGQAGPYSETLNVVHGVPGGALTVALQGTGVVPTASLSPRRVSFGTVAVGEMSAAQTITLSNTGLVPLAVNGVSSMTEFHQTNNCPATLPVGGSCSISVTFTPADAGQRPGNLEVSTNAPTSPHVAALTGSGELVAKLVLDPTSVAFSDQVVGSTSGPVSISLTSDGTADVLIGQVALHGANTTDFELATDSCSGQTLTPEMGCQLVVRFKPTATGSRSGHVEVPSNASGSPHTVPLTGSGMASTGLVVDPGTLAFGSQPLGAAATQPIVITNTGASGVTLTYSIGGSAASDFGVVEPPACMANLAAGATCQAEVQFNPTAVGWRAAALTIVPDSGPAVTASLSGTGQGPAVSFDPGSVTFPPQYVNTTSDVQEVYLKNTGNATLAISSIAVSSGFIHSSSCQSLAPNAFCVISLRAQPAQPGQLIGVLTASSNAPGSPHTVPLEATALAPPQGFLPPGTAADQPLTVLLGLMLLSLGVALGAGLWLRRRRA